MKLVGKHTHTHIHVAITRSLLSAPQSWSMSVFLPSIPPPSKYTSVAFSPQTDEEKVRQSPPPSSTHLPFRFPFSGSCLYLHISSAFSPHLFLQPPHQLHWHLRPCLSIFRRPEHSFISFLTGCHRKKSKGMGGRVR